MTEEVAKIQPLLGEELLKDYTDLEIVLDADGNTVMNPDDAFDLLAPEEYSLIPWKPAIGGAPFPKKRPKH